MICRAIRFSPRRRPFTRLGATPVFVDIEPDTCNLDAANVAERVTSRTRAIIPFTCTVNAPTWNALGLARLHGLAVIEDACQAIGGLSR